MSSRKQKILKVADKFDLDIGNHNYVTKHFMQPHRVSLARDPVARTGLLNKMQVDQPGAFLPNDMAGCRAPEYISYLADVTCADQKLHQSDFDRYLLTEDCPVFTGMSDYCQRYTGASVSAATMLNHGSADVAINWAGGLHHAKKAELRSRPPFLSAAGFCYVGDIVLAILELLRVHQRVLYIDIDVHHGDGVEEAFLNTDRVMTVSLHKYDGSFFPRTGSLGEMGVGEGRGYAVNVPLKDGITDLQYTDLVRSVLGKVMEVYRPDCIVLQSGADSLAGDLLGPFELTMRGHADCVTFMQSFNLPLLVLGGGGYTIANVARCWAYETGRILGEELPAQLPENGYKPFFGPQQLLHIQPSGRRNGNTTKELANLKMEIHKRLGRLPHAPSVGLH